MWNGQHASEAIGQRPMLLEGKMIQQSKYRYPSINGAMIQKIRSEKNLNFDLEERAFAVFRRSVVEFCGKQIGKHLRSISSKTMSGAELGRITGHSRQAVHTWFTEGIFTFSGLVLAISELDL